MQIENRLDFSDEVQEARAKGMPIVALESTIIAHGMPFPVNIETAKEVEQIVRDNGATPATIAVLDGKIKIGLSDDELNRLANSNDVEKVSRRDLPYVIATKRDGATTVAATMICANLAGIQVFVTGGIGGVHRDAQNTMDISADLIELSQTNVAVVCAGAKSILDIGLTLEYLETHGVPVIGYKATEFPAFYCRKSGYQVNYQGSNPREIAGILNAKWNLGLQGGAVIANPVPEGKGLDEKYIQGIIDTALMQAKENSISGKRVTPYLLDKIKELTGGESLRANIALVKHNAEIGTQIARALWETGIN